MSPGAKSFTFEPIATTSPANSCPTTIGTGIVRCAQASQARMCRSVPQMPVRSTRISTSLMPTSGSGASTSQSPGRASDFASAFTPLRCHAVTIRAPRPRSLRSGHDGTGRCGAARPAAGRGRRRRVVDRGPRAARRRRAPAPTQVAIRAGVAAFALTPTCSLAAGRGTFAAFRSVGRAGAGRRRLARDRLLAASSSRSTRRASRTCCCSRRSRRSSPRCSRGSVMREPILAAHLDRDGRGAGGRGHHGRRLARQRPACAAICSALVMSSASAVVIVITRRHREISMTPATALGMLHRVRRDRAVRRSLGGLSRRDCPAAGRARRRADRSRADPLHGGRAPHPGRAGRV